MASEFQDWLRKGMHLPESLRDFHDQKDAFKAIHELSPPADPIIKRPDWIAAQCYTVDVFLRFMAVHGYTLQRSRAGLPFHDFEATVEKQRLARNQQADALLGAYIATNRVAPVDPATPQHGTNKTDPESPLPQEGG